MIALYLAGLVLAAAAIVTALRISWRRQQRPRPYPLSRCEVCGHLVTSLKLTPCGESCRWVCFGCYCSLNDDGASA